MRFLDVFDPPGGLARRRSLGGAWAALAAWFDAAGYDVDVTFRLAEVRAFWESIPAARRARMRMPPAQDCAFHDADESNTLVLVASRQGEGRVSTIGMRRIWLDRSLASTMQDLSFWYADKADDMARVGKTCEVTARAAFELESVHVAWMGGGFNLGADPSVYKALSRAALLYAAAHWEINAVCGIVERSTFRLHGWDYYGFTRAELGVWRDGLEFLLGTLPRRDLLDAASAPAFGQVATPLAGLARQAKSRPLPQIDRTGTAAEDMAGA